MAEQHYLKNAWAEKDASRSYWLYIKAGDLSSMFLLSELESVIDPVTGEIIGDTDDLEPRRALAAWLAEQDSANGKS